LDDANFLLLVQIQIEDIISPVISDHTRNILSNFPSWTKIYSDSLERATPSLATPETTAGKLINSLINDDLDRVDELISRIELDSFINSADQTEIAWAYTYTPVRPGFVKVTGDNAELARVSTIKDLLDHRTTDYVFYYNFISGELITIKEFKNLYIDNTLVNPVTTQMFNSFDEFGLRVGLQRLYLESNSNFAKRILDVNQNPPAINSNNFKLTLRRELDIWRAFGATPNSDYLGATPEVLEISDLESIAKYFTKEGIPTDNFINFVQYLNTQYPSNYGYIKWGESYWDYAGAKQEGVSSLPTILDAATTSFYSEVYQPGVGDFEDARIKLEKIDKEINKYSFGLRVSGLKFENTEPAYEPINIVYDSYISYYEDYIENDTATVTYDVELLLNLHGDIPNDAVYKARYIDYVKNIYGQSSSPEFLVKNIFTSSNFTSGESVFYNSSGDPYTNTFTASATESYRLSEIPLYAVDAATISFVSATGPSGATGNYATIGFLDATPNTYAKDTSKKIIKTASQINDSPYAIKLKIGSQIYNPTKKRIVNTPKIRSHRFGNTLNNSNDITQKTNITFTPQDVVKNFTIPYGATPIYVHISNVVEDSYDIDLSTPPYQGYGGISKNRDNGLTYLIPATPNILFSFITPNFATPNQHESYINTVGSTVNYYFTNIKFPYKSTPNQLVISSNDSSLYPFDYMSWEKFTADYENQIDFYISDEGVLIDGATSSYQLMNNKKPDLIGYFDFQRSDFGLGDYGSSPNLWISDIEILNENDNVAIYGLWHTSMLQTAKDFGASVYDSSFVDQSMWQRMLEVGGATPEGLLNYLNPTTGKYHIKNVPFYAQYLFRENYSINPSIKTGWYYQNGEDRYIYAKPKFYSEYSNTEFLLPQVARQGAPIIVTVDDEEYTQVSFFDEATPTTLSEYNYEYIIARFDDYIALAYKDVYDITIYDQYTGEIVATGLSTENNIINSSVLNSTGLIEKNKEYKITYKVKKTFTVDNQYYNEFDNSYRTKINILHTESSTPYIDVTYESSVFDSDFEDFVLPLNPLITSVDEGYIYLSHNEYDFDKVEGKLSPNQIIANSKDFMALNIWTKDINKNPKQAYYVDIITPNGSATPSSVQTGEDGYARAYIKYTGSNVATPTTQYVYINALDAWQGNVVSSATVNYYVKPQLNVPKKVTSEVTKKVINADGVETVDIIGHATPNAKVYWRRGRNLYETLNRSYSTSTSEPNQSQLAGMTTANSNGDFSIGHYRAQNDATPGYWFVVVDSEFASTPNANPVTIAGDIVYWYERYDVNQSNSAEPTLTSVEGSTTNYYHYLENPVFKKNPNTDKVFYENSFKNSWNLPKWYPVSRYEQYQMGLLGATPYVVESYKNLHPDYEEE